MRVLGSIIALAGLTMCGPASTDNIDTTIPLNTSAAAMLAAACSGCHAHEGSAIIDLSALSREELAARLLTYKSEVNGATVMHRLARGYSEQDLATIAAYISAPSSGGGDD